MAIVGLFVARQLSEVPENTIKAVVGVMLCSFGLFWTGEGAGVRWPGEDLFIPVLVAYFVVVYFAFTPSCAPAYPSPCPRMRQYEHHRPIACAPLGSSGGTSWSATLRSWRWPPAARSGWPSAGGQSRVAAILLPLLAAGFLFVSTYRGRKRAPGS